MGFGEFMARVLKRKPETTEHEVKEAKEGAEAMNKALPKSLSGRDAVLKKREQMRQIDKMLEER